MGNAGRVLMIPKGDYNAATTYGMLDFVYYQGRSYVCKQTSTGHAPTDTTYWQALTGDASAEIQALTNEVRGNWSEGGVNKWQNGDVSGTTYVSVNLDNPLPAGTYTFSAVVTSSDTDKSVCRIADANGTNTLALISRSTGGARVSATFTISAELSVMTFYASETFYYSTGDTFSFENIQIEEGSTATPYQPYALPNTTLTSQCQALTNYVAENNVKNFLPVTAQTQDKNGLTFTVNNDGSVTVTGTASAQTDFVIGSVTLKEGQSYILSGCPSGGSTTSYRLNLLDYGSDTGSGYEVTAISTALSPNVYIRFNSGYAISGSLVFKPMITDANIPDSDYAHYQPYAKTNVELTQDGIMIGEITATTSGSGNIDLGLFKNSYAVLSAFVLSEGDRMAIPCSWATDNWGLHIARINASHDVISDTSVTVRYFYKKI